MHTLKTTSGKTIINRITGIPIYTKKVEYRIRELQKQLGYNNGRMTNDQRWASIVFNVQRIKA